MSHKHINNSYIKMIGGNKDVDLLISKLNMRVTITQIHNSITIKLLQQSKLREHLIAFKLLLHLILLWLNDEDTNEQIQLLKIYFITQQINVAELFTILEQPKTIHNLDILNQQIRNLPIYNPDDPNKSTPSYQQLHKIASTEISKIHSQLEAQMVTQNPNVIAANAEANRLTIESEAKINTINKIENALTQSQMTNSNLSNLSIDKLEYEIEQLQLQNTTNDTNTLKKITTLIQMSEILNDKYTDELQLEFKNPQDEDIPKNIIIESKQSQVQHNIFSFQQQRQQIIDRMRDDINNLSKQIATQKDSARIVLQIAKSEAEHKLQLTIENEIELYTEFLKYLEISKHTPSH